MAETKIADLYIPGAVSPVLRARLYDQNNLTAYGAAVFDPDNLARQGGNTVTVRQNNMLNVDAFADNGTGRTPTGPTMRSVVAPVLRRWFLLGVSQRIKAALGEQNREVINQEIVDQAAPMWAREMRKAAIKALLGATDPSTGCLAATNIHTVNSAKGDGKANFNAVADAKAKNGDASADLGVAFLHSKVYNDLYKEDASKFKTELITLAGGGQMKVELYQNMYVVQLDALGYTGTGGTGDPKVYRSVFVKPGSIVYYLQSDLELEEGPDMTTRRQLISHALPFAVGIYGVSWKGTPADAEAGATDVELATPSNWEVKATDPAREVGLSILLSN